MWEFAMHLAFPISTFTIRETLAIRKTVSLKGRKAYRFSPISFIIGLHIANPVLMRTTKADAGCNSYARLVF
jgi:hypothetical protein